MRKRLVLVILVTLLGMVHLPKAHGALQCRSIFQVGKPIEYDLKIFKNNGVGAEPGLEQQISDFFLQISRLTASTLRHPEHFFLDINSNSTNWDHKHLILSLKYRLDANGRYLPFTWDSVVRGTMAHEWGHAVFNSNLPEKYMYTDLRTQTGKKWLVVSALNELFADAFAVSDQNDGKIMSHAARVVYSHLSKEQREKYSLQRDFTVSLDPQTWHEEEVHARFAPCRGFLGKYLLDPRNRSHMPDLLFSIHNVILQFIEQRFEDSNFDPATENSDLIEMFQINLSKFSHS